MYSQFSFIFILKNLCFLTYIETKHIYSKILKEPVSFENWEFDSYLFGRVNNFYDSTPTIRRLIFS